MTPTPTDEQQAALRTFNQCASLKINAFAGTGKTLALQMMAESTQRNGIYLAFNKAISNKANRLFPNNVTATTSHSRAFRSVINKGYSRDQMLGKLNPKAISQALNLPFLYYGKQRSINPTSYGYLIAETVRSYAYSDRPEITPDMVPLPGNLQALEDEDKKDVQRQAAKRATDMWLKMKDPYDERFPLGHDGYFKLWALSKPRLEADFCLLDEAQDSNPALLSVLKHQTIQVVFVGDRFQQIYEWRGAINAMEKITTLDTLYLSHSFRFGKCIADFASKLIQVIDSKAVVHGSTDITSQFGCDNPDAILSRTNASLIEYMIKALEAGRSPFIVGGTSELKWMLEDVGILKSGRPATHPEFFGFKNWHEVLEFVEQPEGEQLITFVKIVRKFGESLILAALEKTASAEYDGDLILSTAHKAKGLEWPTVMLADDFPAPIQVTSDNEKSLKKQDCVFMESPDGNKYAISAEEIRLLYVASTRAQRAVHLPEWCVSFFGVEQQVSPLRFEPKPTTIATTKPAPATGNDGPEPEEMPTSSSLCKWLLAVLAMATGLFFKIHDHIAELYPNKTITPAFLKQYQKIRMADAKPYPKSLVLATDSIPVVATTTTPQEPPVKPTWVTTTAPQKPSVGSDSSGSEKTTASSLLSRWWFAALAAIALLYLIMG